MEKDKIIPGIKRLDEVASAVKEYCRLGLIEPIKLPRSNRPAKGWFEIRYKDGWYGTSNKMYVVYRNMVPDFEFCTESPASFNEVPLSWQDKSRLSKTERNLEKFKSIAERSKICYIKNNG